jgi:hypothetical protein
VTPLISIKSGCPISTSDAYCAASAMFHPFTNVSLVDCRRTK